MRKKSSAAAKLISQDIKKNRAKLLKLAKQHGAKRVQVFGSVVRGNARMTSDVDVLVSMRPGRTLTDMAAIKESFTRTLKRPVDVVAASGLSSYMRDAILRDAQPL